MEIRIVVGAALSILLIGAIVFAIQFASPEIRDAAGVAALAMIISSPVIIVIAAAAMENLK